MLKMPSGRPDVYLWVLICFFLSGFTGLIYQTAWSQQLTLVFGASEPAVATVLAAYMGGLALGAAWAGARAARLRRPVLAYALLEAGIGICALFVPCGLRLADALQVWLLGGTELGVVDQGSTLFYLVASFAILLLPTALMGATLPVLARHAVTRDDQLSARIGWLYTVNTAGAALGALFSAFFLLPHWGLLPTVWTAVLLNGLIFLCAGALDRASRAAPSLAGPAPETPSRMPADGRFILPVMLVSGAVSFTFEVFWTRLLTHVLGGSVYAFGTMLATFLVGLALGAGLALRFATDRERARLAFAAAEAGVAILFLGAFWLADFWPGLGASGAHRPWTGAGLAALVLLPGALCLGATFPLAVRIRAASAEQASAASGAVFAWNTVGAIVGAIGGAFFVLPALGYAHTARGLALVSLALALWVLRPAPRPRAAGRLAVLGVVALLTVGLWPLAPPWQLLRHSPLGQNQQPADEPSASGGGDVVFHAVGRSANVLLVDQLSGWRLTTNGLPESLIERPGVRLAALKVARYMAGLPTVARPQGRSWLVVGLGGGVMLEEIPPSVTAIDVVELEPQVIAANRAVSSLRRKDPLADPRVRLHINDARSALRLGTRRFDAIVSQPSHPWTAGSSHLFTREFFQLVHDRLNPEGVFLQWIGVSFIDDELLRSLVATLTDVFPQLEVYVPQGSAAVLFLGAKTRLQLVANGEAGLALAPTLWPNLGVDQPLDFAVARWLDDRGARAFGGNAPRVTDGHNWLKTRAPQILTAPLRIADLEELLAAFDPLPGMDLDRCEVVRRLLRERGTVARARRVAAQITERRAQQLAAAMIARAAGETRQAEQLLRSLLLPGSDATGERRRVLSELLQLYREEIRRGQQLALIADLADPEAAVVAGWQASGASDWTALRQLEARLATIPARDPLAPDALRLRAEWRIHRGTPAEAAAAAALVEAAASGFVRWGDLLLRAEAGVAALDLPIASVSLVEIADGLRAGWIPGKVLPQALSLLDRLARSVPDPEAPRIAVLRQRFAELESR